MSSKLCSPETWEPDFVLTTGMVLARLGYRKGVDAAPWMPLIEDAIELVRRVSDPRAGSIGLPLRLSGPAGVGMPGALFESRDLFGRLSGCDRCTVFLLTLGARIDEEIDLLKETPSRQVILDAAASEAAEASARWLQGREAARAMAAGFRTVHRFSPGYGDFSIDGQRWFVDSFPGLGVEIAPSGMMVPRKSVSGVIGWMSC